MAMLLILEYSETARQYSNELCPAAMEFGITRFTWVDWKLLVGLQVSARHDSDPIIQPSSVRRASSIACLSACGCWSFLINGRI